jgi:hypothetical protein
LVTKLNTGRKEDKEQKIAATQSPRKITHFGYHKIRYGFQLLKYEMPCPPSDLNRRFMATSG